MGTRTLSPRPQYLSFLINRGWNLDESDTDQQTDSLQDLSIAPSIILALEISSCPAPDPYFPK